MNTALQAGSEIDSYCTKCKIDLNHRIVAMDGVKVKRVECLTCGGRHNYRVPKSEREKIAAKKTRARRAPAKPKIDPNKVLWEQAIVGRTPDEFTNYTTQTAFVEGQLLCHKKFGDGVVAEVVEDGKITVAFEDGLKLLIHSQA